MGGGVVLMGVLLVARQAAAFSLGIGLDEFLGQFETALVSLGLIAFLAGGIGTIVAMTENAYAQFLSGYLSLFVKGGILGGLSTIGGALGLVSGALIVGA
jgi:hypothetical protein